VQHLAKLVEDKDPAVRWNVAVALGDIGHNSGVQYLVVSKKLLRKRKSTSDKNHYSFSMIIFPLTSLTLISFPNKFESSTIFLAN
jgi:hypothetical protein